MALVRVFFARNTTKVFLRVVCCNGSKINKLQISQFPGGGLFDCLSQWHRCFIKWRVGRSLSIISTLSGCQTDFAIQSIIVCLERIPEQGQCFQCYVQSSAKYQSSAEVQQLKTCLSNDDLVKLDSDAGSWWRSQILDLWPMSLPRLLLSVSLLSCFARSSQKDSKDWWGRGEEAYARISMGHWSRWWESKRRWVELISVGIPPSRPKTQTPHWENKTLRCSYLQSQGRLLR